jgi:hypothetical protein
VWPVTTDEAETKIAMGFLKRLFGGDDERQREELRHATPRVTRHDGRMASDEQAIARYHYLVRTAPPEAIEQAHEQGFAQRSPKQRRIALRELSKTLPAHERIDRDDPKSLARMATRAELQQPGVVERIFSGRSPMMGGGYGYGDGLFGGGFMSSLAGSFVGSIIAQGLYDSFFDIPEYNGGDPDASAGDYGGVESATAENEYGTQDAGQDFGNDVGGDFGGTEL